MFFFYEINKGFFSKEIRDKEIKRKVQLSAFLNLKTLAVIKLKSIKP